MTDIGSRPYPQPWNADQKKIAEPAWNFADECELMDLAEQVRASVEVEKNASEYEIRPLASRLGEHHSGGGLDAGPAAMRKDADLIAEHAEADRVVADMVEECANEVREHKVDVSVIGAYGECEQRNLWKLFPYQGRELWQERLIAERLQLCKDLALQRADQGEVFQAGLLKKLADVENAGQPALEADLADLDGPRVSRHAELSAEQHGPADDMTPAWAAEAGQVELETAGAEGRRPGVEADAFEQHKNAWPPQPGHEPQVPAWGDEQARREREQPVNFGDTAVHDAHTGATDSGTQTEAMSGAAVHDTEPEQTDLQAGGLTAPGEVYDVDLNGDDSSAQAAAAQTMMNPGVMGQGETQYRPGGAHGYHGEDGLYGDRRADQLPTDDRSVLARQAKWFHAQPDLFDPRGLAPKGQPKYVLARHLDDEGRPRDFVYPNLGPGVLAKRLPRRAWPGWEHAGDPVVRAVMLGCDDPVWAAKRHFEQQRDLWAAHGRPYSLAGMALTYKAEESARRAIQSCNDHLRGVQSVEAPFLVEAEGPLVEPEDGSAHPLEYVAPELHKRIADVLAGPWAPEAHKQALGWVARIIEGSGVEDWDGFSAVADEIKQRQFVTHEAFNAACRDGAQIAAQTWRNLAHAAQVPEEQRTYVHFMGFLSYHRALIGLAALGRWGHAQTVKDPSFVFDLAYLIVKACENDGDPDLVPRMIAQLPDPGQSYWRPK